MENNEKQIHDSFRCSNTKTLVKSHRVLAAVAFSLSSFLLSLVHFPSGSTVFANLKSRGNEIKETVQEKR